MGEYMTDDASIASLLAAMVHRLAPLDRRIKLSVCEATLLLLHM